MIRAASQHYLDEIRRNWETAAAELYARNGTNPKFYKGGQDVAGNPALRDTMAKIAESYLPLCARKAELFDQRNKANNRTASEGQVDHAFDQLGKITAELKAIDAALVIQNQKNLALVLAPGSGLDHEVKRQSEGRPVMEIKLDCAVKVISAVAKAVVGTCQSHLYVPGDAVDYIPRKFEEPSIPAHR